MLADTTGRQARGIDVALLEQAIGTRDLVGSAVLLRTDGERTGGSRSMPSRRHT